MDITLTGQLHEEIEPNNPVDKYAVAVKKWENSWASTIIKEKKKKEKFANNNFLFPSS